MTHKLGKYMVAEQNDNAPGHKTSYWSILSAKDADTLGWISWYGRWRQFAFSPATASVFNNQCLIDLAAFLKKLNDLNKQGRVPTNEKANPAKESA